VVQDAGRGYLFCIQCRARCSAATFRTEPDPMRCIAFSLVMLVAAAVPAAAQSPAAAPATPAAQVDELFQRWHTPDSLVMDSGRVVHVRGYGMANLDHGIPIRANTVFDIASVSKQFGALAIALLEADGLVRLDDDVRRYVPELPDFGHVITLRHLVHHTSGIRDWPGTMRVGGWDYQDIISFEQILRLAYGQRELNFAPGTEYAYSNTGYNLLAEVVQRVSGRSFREFTNERIFRPLGMRDTHFHDDPARVVRNRAESYRPGPDGEYRRVGNSLTALGSSSLFTTVEDLARWIANFDDPVVGGAGVVARLHEQGVLSSGERIAYAFGHNIGAYRGARTVTHTGSWAGFRTVLQRFPDERFAVVVLANTTDMNPSALASRIADIWLGTRLAAPRSVAGGGGGAGAPVERWAPDAAALRAYAGRYHSPELDTAWLLEVDDGRLVARHFRAGSAVLQPVAPDHFRGGSFGDVRFERDAAGAVAGFTANSDRVRRLRFDRID
jgi:CubicO group peptidase (beta-lactamase class C family)